jgi:hypothetical protein
MSAFINKKMNIGISVSTASSSQAVTGVADLTLFSANGFTPVAGNPPGIYLPTTSTIYLPKGFYYFVECSLKMYRGTNGNYLDYAIVDSSNVQLSNTSRINNITDSGTLITFSYPKKTYAFINCISSSKTIKIRTFLTYDIDASTSGVSLAINSQQDATASSNYVHSEPQSNIVIKSWKPQGFENNSYVLTGSSDVNEIAMTSTPQMSSSFLNKYASFDGVGNYTYLTPVTPSINDFLGVVFVSGTGSFILKNNATGILLTGSKPITKYSIRKSFLFRYDGTEWIDIGDFDSTNLPPLYT